MRIYRKIKTRAPSTSAAIDRLRSNPDWPTLTINRPEGTQDLPITLLHPVFGRFLDECDSISPMRPDYTLALELSEHMRKSPEVEPQRVDGFNKIINGYLDAPFALIPGLIPGSQDPSDGHAIVDNRLLILTAAKKEVGATGAEPLVQASYHYVEWGRKAVGNHLNSVMPCLFIVYFGKDLSTFKTRWDIMLTIYSKNRAVCGFRWSRNNQ